MNMGRVIFLTKAQLVRELPFILFSLLMVAGLQLLSLLNGGDLIPYRAGTGDIGGFLSAFTEYSWYLWLILTGMVLAARSFRGMHGAAAAEWLLQPVNTTERLAAAHLFISVLLPATVFVLATVVSVLARANNPLDIYGNRIVLFNPFSAANIEFFLQYWMLTGLCFAGSASFKRLVVLKSLAVALLAHLLFGLLLMFPLVTLKMASDISYVNGQFYTVSESLEETVRVGRAQEIFDSWRYLWIPACALVYSFFRIREQEARDALQ